MIKDKREIRKRVKNVSKNEGRRINREVKRANMWA